MEAPNTRIVRRGIGTCDQAQMNSTNLMRRNISAIRAIGLRSRGPISRRYTRGPLVRARAGNPSRCELEWIVSFVLWTSTKLTWLPVPANEMPTGAAPRPAATTGLIDSAPPRPAATTGLIDSPPPGSSPASESPTGPATGVIAGAATGGVIGALLVIGLLWFWCRRRPSGSASASKDQGHGSASPPFQPELIGSGKLDLKAEATRSTTTAPTPDYYQPEASERTDVFGGLPSSDELRRMKPGAQFGGLRGAPSVMTTDLSETLTIGDADGYHRIDDIHVIGRGG
jgi:hypothetical protein